MYAFDRSIMTMPTFPEESKALLHQTNDNDLKISIKPVTYKMSVSMTTLSRVETFILYVTWSFRHFEVFVISLIGLCRSHVIQNEVNVSLFVVILIIQFITKLRFPKSNLIKAVEVSHTHIYGFIFHFLSIIWVSLYLEMEFS